MRIVAKNAQKRKGLRAFEQGIVIDRVLSVGEHGICVKNRFGTGRPSHLDGVKRGEIKCFSRGSARRLREALFRYGIKDSLTVGVTLTVPWHSDDFGPLMNEWRSCFERFQMAFIRRFPNSAAIYRNEVQRRGAPHVHAVAYISADDIRSLGSELPAALHSQTKAQRVRRSLDCEPSFVSVEGDWECSARLRRQDRDHTSSLSHKVRTVNPPPNTDDWRLVEGWLRSLWINAVAAGRNMHGGSFRDFVKHGMDFDALDASVCGNLFRYLADHSSKHKSEQLGYKGKQWGYIGRKNLTSEGVERLPPFDSEKHEACFWRIIRKVTRYRLDHSPGSAWSKGRCKMKAQQTPERWFTKCPWKRLPPFGYVMRGGHRRVGVILASGGRKTVYAAFENARTIAGKPTGGAA